VKKMSEIDKEKKLIKMKKEITDLTWD